MLLENTSLNLCLHWLGFKVNHSLLIEPFLRFITLFKPVSDCILFKLGRRKPCFLKHYMVYLTQRLRQYTPKKEAREDRLVVKLLSWDFGNLGAASPSVWHWESLEVGKRGSYQGQPNQKWSCGDSFGCSRAQGSCLGSRCCLGWAGWARQWLAATSPLSFQQQLEQQVQLSPSSPSSFCPSLSLWLERPGMTEV